MKKILIVLLVLISGVINAQNKSIEFINKNLNKKVGGGGCFDLVAKAQGNVQWYNEKWKKRGAYRVRLGCPKAGDVIEFDEVVFCKRNDGVEYRLPSHVGIVYEVLGDGNIVYADNWGEKSSVLLSIMNYKKIKVGKIKFYRF